MAKGPIAPSPVTEMMQHPLLFAFGFEEGDVGHFFNRGGETPNPAHILGNYQGRVEDTSGNGLGHMQNTDDGLHGIETVDHHGAGTGVVHTGQRAWHGVIGKDSVGTSFEVQRKTMPVTWRSFTNDFIYNKIHTIYCSGWYYFPSTFPRISLFMLFQFKLRPNGVEQPWSIWVSPRDDHPGLLEFEYGIREAAPDLVHWSGKRWPLDQWVNITVGYKASKTANGWIKVWITSSTGELLHYFERQNVHTLGGAYPSDHPARQAYGYWPDWLLYNIGTKGNPLPVDVGMYVDDLMVTSPLISSPRDVIDPTTPIPPEVGAPITDIQFFPTTHRRKGAGADNWPTTWLQSGDQLAAWGDGFGFNANVSPKKQFGYSKISGTRDAYTGTDVFLGANSPSDGSEFDAKSYGVLAIGGSIYAWHLPGSGTKNFDSATLYKSIDGGQSWATTGVQFVEADGVMIPWLMQAGRAYESAPDGNVYTYWINVKQPGQFEPQTPGEVVLSRVATGSIETEAAYEWWNGSTWGTLGSRAPVHTDASGLFHGSTIYLTKAKRYVMLIAYGADFAVGNLKVLEAPAPTGPWTVVKKFTGISLTGNSETPRSFYYNISAKWMTNNDQDFVLIWTGFNGPQDSWNTVEGKFTFGTAPPPPEQGISLPSGVIVVSGLPVEVSTSAQSISLSGVEGNVLVSGEPPTVVASGNAFLEPGDVTVTGDPPAVDADLTVSLGQGDVTVTGDPPTVANGVAVTLPAGDVTVDGDPPVGVSGAAVIPLFPEEEDENTETGREVVVTGHAPTVITTGPGGGGGSPGDPNDPPTDDPPSEPDPEVEGRQHEYRQVRARR